jgi:hypothetical protein
MPVSLDLQPQQCQSDVPDSATGGLRHSNSNHQPRTTDYTNRGLQHSSYQSDVSDYTMVKAQHKDYRSTTPDHGTGGLQHSLYPDPVDSSWHSDSHEQAAPVGYYHVWLD